MLANTLSQYWWLILVRGLFWVLFGLFLFASPGLSILTLTLMFGFFAFIDGIGYIVNAIGGRDEQQHWWLLLLGGIAGVLVGVLAFVNPRSMAFVLLFWIGVWALATGFLEIVAAIRLRKEIQGELWLGLSGVLSMVFGALMIARPAAGALAVVWIIGAYAVLFGAMLIGLAFRVRSLPRVNAAFRM